MCLILFAHDAHPEYRLVLAANRDEFYARPTAAAHWWADTPGLLAGRDLRSGGTWLGVTRGGRIAALTNVRDPEAERGDAPTRGALVRDFLAGSEAPDVYLRRLAPRAGAYNGFNLLAGDGRHLLYYGSPEGRVRELSPGVYGLSNHLLDTPWPKVERGRAGLAAVLRDGGGVEPEALFRLLADAEPAADAELPDTGVDRAWERALSSPFISTPEYGTRASAVLLVSRDGVATFIERTFSPPSRGGGEARFTFRIER